jgi:hypothetical protein
LSVTQRTQVNLPAIATKISLKRRFRSTASLQVLGTEAVASG